MFFRFSYNFGRRDNLQFIQVLFISICNIFCFIFFSASFGFSISSYLLHIPLSHRLPECPLSPPLSPSFPLTWQLNHQHPSPHTLSSFSAISPHRLCLQTLAVPLIYSFLILFSPNSNLNVFKFATTSSAFFFHQ